MPQTGFVQTGNVPTSLTAYSAGEKYSKVGCRIQSSRYNDTSTENDHPIPFGYAVGNDGEGSVNQEINRVKVFELSAALAHDGSSIGWDNDASGVDTSGRNQINDGDYLVIGSEVLYVVSAGTNAINVAREQKGSSQPAGDASHASGSPVYKLNGENTFAGVAMRDMTLPGRLDANEVDKFIESELIPVAYEGEMIVACDAAITASDVNGPVSVVMSGDDQGMFSTGESATKLHIRNAKFLGVSEDLGSGSTPRYIAPIRLG